MSAMRPIPPVTLLPAANDARLAVTAREALLQLLRGFRGGRRHGAVPCSSLTVAVSLALALALALSACGSAPSQPTARPPTADALPDFAFLVGAWRTAADPATGAETTETWLPARSGVMFGVGRVDAGGSMRFHERLRLERRDVAGCPFAYVAAPAGQAEVAFCLVALRPNAAIFANPEHDFPQKIEYVRTGDRLDAAIEGPLDGKLERRSWTFHKHP